MSNESEKKRTLKDEIDIVDIIRPLFLAKGKIVKITFLVIFLGLVVTFFSEKKFIANGTFIPQSSEKAGDLGGQLGGLANLAGFALNGSQISDEFPPNLYPRLLENIDFQLSILDSPLFLQGWNDSLTYREYYMDYYSPSLISSLIGYTVGLPGLIIEQFRSDEKSEGEVFDYGLPQMSKSDMRLIENFFSQISIDPDVRGRYVDISMSMPNPVLAAQMAKHVEKLIHEYLIDYKTKKAMQELNYIEENFSEKKKEFEDIQVELSLFQDQNQNLNTALANNQLKRLESKYDLALQIYSSLAARLEDAKLKLSRETPLITIIKPITIPLKKSGPRMMNSLFIGIFLGLFVSVVVVFLPGWKRIVKEKMVIPDL